MRNEIRFFLNGRPCRIADTPPYATALDWLRGEGLTAVKEGCAEGDCGACSVLIGRPDASGARLDWRAINSCILMLPQLDGAAVLTAEGLVGADGAPHPAQTALAEAHGTQCGFCSPGFAISLADLARRPERDDRTILDALAGNLCRCTGYRPIVDAARSLPVTAPAPDEAAMAATLAADCAEPLDYCAGTHRFVAPGTLDDALRVLNDHPDAWILAGGTDLGLRLTKQHEEPACVLSLARIAELHAIDRDGDTTVIGAAVPYADALSEIAELAPAFADLVRRIGAAQIRAQGTIGGNLGNASPIGDSAPALIALAAEIETVAADGRRHVPVEDFFTGYRKTVLRPGEIIAAIRIPRPGADTRLRIYKIARRVDQDISAVSAAFALEVRNGRVDAARVAFGGVAERPIRIEAVEAALTGREWSLETARAAGTVAGASVHPIDDARGSAEYRRAVSANLLERLWWDTAPNSGAIVTDLDTLAESAA